MCAIYFAFGLSFLGSVIKPSEKIWTAHTIHPQEHESKMECTELAVI